MLFTNTTLTIEYTHGGGIDDNVNVGDVNQLGSISFTINENGLSTSLVQESKDSVSFSNPKPKLVVLLVKQLLERQEKMH